MTAATHIPLRAAFALRVLFSITLFSPDDKVFPDKNDKKEYLISEAYDRIAPLY